MDAMGYACAWLRSIKYIEELFFNGNWSKVSQIHGAWNISFMTRFNLIPICGGLKSHLQKWTCSVYTSHIIISYPLRTCPKQAWAIHTIQQGQLQLVTSLKPGHSRKISHWFPISSTTLYVEKKSDEVLAQFAAKNDVKCRCHKQMSWPVGFPQLQYIWWTKSYTSREGQKPL